MMIPYVVVLAPVLPVWELEHLVPVADGDVLAPH
jgi:hypothetical protein